MKGKKRDITVSLVNRVKALAEIQIWPFLYAKGEQRNKHLPV